MLPAHEVTHRLKDAMDNSSAVDLDEIYAFAVELGKDAGMMLLDAAKLRMSGSSKPEQKNHVQKENAVDLVTETDESKMHPIFPNHLNFLER